MLAAAQRPENSSEYKFVEIDVIILSVGSASILPDKDHVVFAVFIYVFDI